MDAGEVQVAFVERSGRLLAKDFIEGLQAFLHLLVAAEGVSTEAPARGHWIIQDLHHSAPTVVLRPADPTPSAEAAAKRVHGFGRLAARGEVVSLTDEEERALRSLSDFAPRMEILVTVSSESDDVGLVSNAETLLRAAGRPDTESWGTVDGTLESITIHQRRECSIWNVTTGRRIPVSFDDTMVERITSLFGRRVRAHGRIRYWGHDPVRVALEDIEPTDEPSDVALSCLYGRGRSWFGTAPSGELTRTLWAHDE